MNTILHKAEERGKGDYGWLKTSYSFSFADWYDPARMGFGALRVINDDTIAPAKGFGTHSHRDMEIVTIVLRGTVTHKDSMGNIGTVPAGDVQVMSAGTGVAHSEYNESATEPLELFQIWIEPSSRGIPPRYEQKSFDFINVEAGMTLLVGEGALGINQDARISYAVLDKKHPLSYVIKNGNGVYVFVIDGRPTVSGNQLSRRDALGVSDTDAVDITSEDTAKMLLIDVPME